MEGRRWLLRQLLISALAVAGQTATVSAGDFIRQPRKSAMPSAPTSQAGEARPAPPASQPQTPSSAIETGTSQMQSGWMPIEAKGGGAGGLASSGLNWLPRAMPKSPSVDATTAARPAAAKATLASSRVERSAGEDHRDADAPPAFLQLGIPEVPADVAERTPFDTGYDLQVPAQVLKAAVPGQMDSRRQLASKISSELVSFGPPSTEMASPGMVSALGPGPGWQAVGEKLSERISKCEMLLERRAYLSAKQEIEEGIIYLVRVLDHQQNRLLSETAWAEAQQAMLEAEEFLSKERIANDPGMFGRLVQSHETPVLHGFDVTTLTPMAAAQHYRAYAERKLITASAGHPWFSELYYCLGRAYQAQTDAAKSPGPESFETSLTYYRAAFAIQPENAVNANQLGYVLLRMDRPTEAFNHLIEVVRMPNCPLAAWQNVIEASHRLGNQRTAEWALQNYQARKAHPQAIDGPTGTLVEINPQQFAAISPYASGPRLPAQESQPATARAEDANPNVGGRSKSASALRLGIFR